MNIHSITFIGLGLIGGSIAKAVKEYHPEIEMYSHASEATVAAAFSDGICKNEKPLSIEEIAKSDLIILCAPVDVNIDYAQKLIPHLTNRHILTDVGSVKGDIHHAIRSMGLSEVFVGGHPMAGSEKNGYKYSYKELLEGARYIITTDDGGSNPRSEYMMEFAASLKSRPMAMSFTEHDLTAAAISHLPHVLASALSSYVERSDKTGSMEILAATGFRDTTRIAEGSPEVWQQICMANYEALLTMLRGYQRELRILEDLIESNDSLGLLQYLDEAKRYREKFND